MVLGMGGVLAAAGVITFAVGDEPDYADLVPAPDTIVWEEGDETTVWLQTNRNDVGLRIDSVSLGVGNIERIFAETGTAMTLGRAEGCVDWAVNGLELGSSVHSGTDREVTVAGTVNRNGFTGDLHAYLRTYVEGADLSDQSNILKPSSDYVVVPDGDDDFTWAVTVSPDSKRVFEASHDDDFPEVYTRRITVDPETAEATSDTEAEGLLVPQGGGVGVIACSQHDDALITLHGEDDEELNRYLVDVHRKAAAQPAMPPPDAGYTIRRVCVDATDSQVNYLSGGEEVGGPFDEDDFGLDGTIQSIQLGDTAADHHYQYFFSYTLSSGEVQLLITGAGASGLGLDSDQVYPVRLTATDNTAVADDPDTTEVRRDGDRRDGPPGRWGVGGLVNAEPQRRREV